MSKTDKKPGSGPEKKLSEKLNKNKATSDGGKDVNDGGRPASDVKAGKGNTTGSRGTQ